MMRRQPHLSACRAGCRAARLSQLRVNSQRTANVHRTLRRALEHSADYAGGEARTVGVADAVGPRSQQPLLLVPMLPRHETDCA